MYLQGNRITELFGNIISFDVSLANLPELENSVIMVHQIEEDDNFLKSLFALKKLGATVLVLHHDPKGETLSDDFRGVGAMDVVLNIESVLVDKYGHPQTMKVHPLKNRFRQFPDIEYKMVHGIPIKEKKEK
jgi:hypothetical protein